MITVHHLNNSRSQRVLWLLEELELPYQITRYERDPKTMFAPPSLRAIHPLGKSPVITDADNTVAESGAIIEYLLDRYGNGRLRPAADSPEFLRYRYYLHYAEGSLMPWLLLSLVFLRMPSQRMPFFVKPVVKQISARGMSQVVAPQIKSHLDLLERELTGREWVCGQLSGADIQLSFPIEAAAVRSGLSQHYPHVAAYLQRIRARPAYQRALAKGGELKLG